MLTAPEQKVVRWYDHRLRSGTYIDTEIWADQFAHSVYANKIEGYPMVDVGCGVGRFAPLTKNLYIEGYIGIDPSVESIHAAQELYPEYKFEVGDIYELGTKHPAQFGCFVLVAILMLIPRERLVEALRSLRASLVPGAVGMFSTPYGSGQVENKYGILLTLYSSGEMKTCMEAAGFEMHEPFARSNMMIGSAMAV